MADQRTRLAVVFGGRSGEHSVSCTSAASVLKHLDPERFDVTAIGITRQGRWLRVDPADVPAIAGVSLPEVTTGAEATVRTDIESAALTIRDGAGAGVATLDVDVVFPLLHGPYGEDGTIQGLLELAGLPYVGPGVLASAAAMDKEFTKRLLVSAGLRVAPWAVLRAGETELSAPDRDRLGLPAFVKPARAGSSLGVSRLESWGDLPAAVAAAREYDSKVLVEAAIVGQEVECGVLEFPDGRIEASPTAEIHLGEDRFYDFDAKYLEDVATFDIPARLPDGAERAVRQASVQAFRALDAQGLARVDFFVEPDGEVIVNEVNTMPGFTPISLYPRMWHEAGVPYGELLTTLVDTALVRGAGLR